MNHINQDNKSKVVNPIPKNKFQGKFEDFVEKAQHVDINSKRSDKSNKDKKGQSEQEKESNILIFQNKYRRNESNEFGLDVMKEPTFNMEPYNSNYNAWNSMRGNEGNIFGK